MRTNVALSTLLANVLTDDDAWMAVLAIMADQYPFDYGLGFYRTTIQN